MRDTPETWHAWPAVDVAKRLGVDFALGLEQREAEAALFRDGPNTLPEARPPSLWAVVGRQFASPLILLLLGAAVIAVVLGEYVDAVVVVIVVCLNATVGAIQEGRAERSLASLKKLAARNARVVRDGQERTLLADQLVQGDVLVLSAGDAVAADARVVDQAGLLVAEGVLTGESVPVAKDTVAVDEDAPVADRVCMVFSGTHVVAGRGTAVVVATGPRTAVGTIATLASSTAEAPTPLQRRVKQLGRNMVVASATLFVIVLVLGRQRGVPTHDLLMVAISQIVGLVPEGLPVAMTVALAVGVQRMATRLAIVRRLSAVEALGSTTVFCTDKTGTITRNEMTATAVLLPDGRALGVSGTGFAPRGQLTLAEHAVRVGDLPELDELLRAVVLCNDATLLQPASVSDPLHFSGDPTEIALLALALKAGVDVEQVRVQWPRCGERPFASETRWMATLHRCTTAAVGAADIRGTAQADHPCSDDTEVDAEGSTVGAVQPPFRPADEQRPKQSGVGEREFEGTVYLKGAPESVLALCRRMRSGGSDIDVDETWHRHMREEVERLAGQALRVLAVAVVPSGRLSELGLMSSGSGATFLGLVGQFDPPREEVQQAVARCQAAGVRPVLITGDHKATALAVARLVGILGPPKTQNAGHAAATPGGDDVIDGRELAAMDDPTLSRRVALCSVFARVQPAQKLRIVEALQARGEVVAMTGDGVNDAPALVKADVGVAMGMSGTEVAKDTAKIILVDDNFATLVAAIEEGRVVYQNIKKALLLLLSTSFAEVGILLGALALGFPPPFSPVQILWNNLVTEGLVTVNLIMEPAEGDEMSRPPTSPHEPLVDRRVASRIVVMVLSIVAVTLTWFFVRTQQGVPSHVVQTEVFVLLVLCEWFNVLNCRSATRSAFTISLRKNPLLLGGLLLGAVLQALVLFAPPLQSLFRTTPIEPSVLGALALAGSVVLWVEEGRKLLRRSFRPR
jgi:magnesium-transporting ATPase (P-type)